MTNIHIAKSIMLNSLHGRALRRSYLGIVTDWDRALVKLETGITPDNLPMRLTARLERRARQWHFEREHRRRKEAAGGRRSIRDAASTQLAA